MAEKRLTNVIAFTWYRREEYQKLLEHAEDSDELHETYQAWLSDARRALVKYKRMGFDPRRVYLEVDDMLEWCELRDKQLNSRSREMYKEIRRQQFYRQFDELMETVEFLDESDED